MSEISSNPLADKKEEETAAATDAAASAQPDDLKKRVEELEAQMKDKEGKYLYLYADFENFKKRQFKERSDLIKFGWENVARDLVEIADNLDRVVEHAPVGTDKNFMDGLKMVQSHFHSSLEKSGVQTVESLHKPFDPNLHEAMGEEPADHPVGTIVREQVPGYMLHGRLLRPARVILASAPVKSG